MADILGAFRTHLLTKSSVTNLLGTAGGIYFGSLPQNVTLPAVVLHRISSEPQEDLSGAAGLVRSRIQCDAYANTHTAADNLSEQIRLVSVAPNCPTSMGSVAVTGCHDAGSRTATDQPRDGSQVWREIESRDLVFWHAESVPST